MGRYVSGTLCYLCLRAGRLQEWRRGWDSDSRRMASESAKYPLARHRNKGVILFDRNGPFLLGSFEAQIRASA
jgi:hypothetical protein